MGAARSELFRNAMSSLGILTVVAGIALGLPALDRALPAYRTVPAGSPYRLTDNVTVVPPPGARLDVTRTRPGRASGYAVFVLGGVRYVVLVSHEQVPLTVAAERLRTRLRDSLDANLTGVAGPLDGVAPAGALAGHFRLGTDNGWYAVRVLGAAVVDATASGPPAELADRLPAIAASAASVAWST